MTTTITKTIFLKATPERVWGFLTDKDKLGLWYHPAEADLAAGQPYRLMKVDENGTVKPLIWGDVLEFEPYAKLVTSFCIPPFADNATKATWELSQVGEGTALLLTHEGVAEAIDGGPLPLLMALDNGWDEHLAQLRQSAG